MHLETGYVPFPLLTCLLHQKKSWFF